MAFRLAHLEKLRTTFVKTLTATIVTVLILVTSLVAQPPGDWQTLTSVPVVNRYNDAFFVSPTRGWIVNGAGQIYRTDDGGEKWTRQLNQGISHFRSVAFLDSLRGWAGNVGVGEYGTTDSTVLYHTEDGGETWLPVEDFQGPQPRGLCGMHVLNDSSIFAVGRVRGPAFFAKTADAGKTWTSKDMREHAVGLIDVYFFNPDSGVAVGLTNNSNSQSSGIVLFTADGGETWEQRHLTSRTGEWCWKITFPSRKVGYVSLQRNSSGPVYFLKTTDGGQTWESKLFTGFHYFVQGIGFITEEVGWIGGTSLFPTYVTTDGGETWGSAGFGVRVNRFRFLGDTLGYAVGERAYKFATSTPVHVADHDGATPGVFELKQNYPNPFNPTTTIAFTLAEDAGVSLKIFDVRGQHVATLVQGHLPAGAHRANWHGTDFRGQKVASGTYVYILRVDDRVQSRKMLVIK